MLQRPSTPLITEAIADAVKPALGPMLVDVHFMKSPDTG
jgi:hypothetical protein